MLENKNVGIKITEALLSARQHCIHADDIFLPLFSKFPKMQKKCSFGLLCMYAGKITLEQEL